MRQPLVSVIIVNWNGRDYLQRCLDALSNQTFTDFEAIVVDNASTDLSADVVEQHYSHIRLLRQQENVGFAKANNLAVAIARGEWIALLNNDAFPERHWLEELTKAAKQYPRHAGFASCQIQANNSSVLDGAGDSYHILGLSWRRGYGQPVNAFDDRASDIFSPCAAAALYRRDRFIEVGGFDENFFCYCEDIDLAYRMNLNGDRFLYVPTARVHHIGSASTNKTSEFARYHGHRNLVWTFVKNTPSSLFWIYLPGHIALNVLILVYFTVKGEARVIWKAKLDAVKNLPQVWLQRRQVQLKRSITATALRQRTTRGFRSLWKRSTLRINPHTGKCALF